MSGQEKPKNIASLLKKRLSPQVFKIIRRVGNLAQDKAIPAYIVGGFVRDLLLGRGNLDLDITMEADALVFVKLLQDKIDLDVVRHQRFGTATVTLADGFKIDLASARREHYACAAALPQVEFSSIREDLLRRDFTINALAVKINRDNFGQLLDLFGGLKDLREGRVRVLHQRSFIDDPTRIFRAIRFEQRYNFSIEADTVTLIKQAARLGMLGKLTKSRIGNEIILILKEANPAKGLLRLSKLCSLKNVHPAIRLNSAMLSEFEAARKAINQRRRLKSGQGLDSWLVYFLILTGKLSFSQIKKLCRDFSLLKKDAQKLEHFKRSSHIALRQIDKDRLMPAHQIYQVLQAFSCEELLIFLSQAKSRRAKNRISLFFNKLSGIELKLTGRDLQRLKVRPGPRYRQIFKQVLGAKLDGKLKSKADELSYVRKLLSK